MSFRHRRKLTWGNFLERAHGHHGDKFDYSGITDYHISCGVNIRVPIRCKVCNHSFFQKITDHINTGHGCAGCANHLSYTLEMLHENVRKVHGDKFDLSEVTEDHVKGNKSKIPVRCLECAQIWTPNITNLLQKHGCPNCANNIRYTFESFLEKTRQLYGGKFDYEPLESIRGSSSKVRIECHRCKGVWSSSIFDHIKDGDCPSCWTFPLFKARSLALYQEKYGYFEVEEEHLRDVDGFVPIACNRCGLEFQVRLGDHVSGKTSCTNCD